MTVLALRTLRFRAGGLLASFVSAFLGAVVVMAFASLLDTSTGRAVSAGDEETLVTMASVVGGWGLVIVVFAVASTLTLSVRQRGHELALLKSVGATPAQVRRLILGEAAALAVVAAVVAVGPAVLAGRLVFELLQDSGQVGPAVTYRFGPIAVAVGSAVTLLAALAAATITARRTARQSADAAMLEGAVDRRGTGRARCAAGWLFLTAGVSCGVVTATVMDGKGTDAMQTAGQAGIWACIGLALFAPSLLRGAVALLAPALERASGASGQLAVRNLCGRARQMAGAVMPILLFTGIATGTLVMQGVEDAAVAGTPRTTEQENIATLNLVVVGMIAMFAAIMVVNTLVAVTVRRRAEFGRLRLAGAAPAQVTRMVALESVVMAGTGAALGTLASLATVLPFSLARGGTLIPETGAATWLGVVAVAVALTLAASLLSVRWTLRIPAVAAANFS